MATPTPGGSFRPSFAAMGRFAAFLAETPRPTAELFEVFCAKEIEYEPDLRQLRIDWEYLRPLGGEYNNSEDYLQYLVQLYGVPGADESYSDLQGSSGFNPARGAPLQNEDAADALLDLLLTRGYVAQKYQFRGKIETGGMGVIWRVWDREARRNLAMKMMKEPTTRAKKHDSNALQHLQVRRFLEEAQITSQLDHPGIVPVHELGIDSSGRVFFTMKLVRGRDLKSIFEDVYSNRGGWNITKAIQIFIRVCEAIAFAHAKGVIHRDLKPGNIMVGRFGEVYVMDWGVARVLSKPDLHDLRIRKEDDKETELSTVHSMRREIRESDPDSPLVTMDGSVLGTPAYMSPEQAMGLLESVGPRSDIYSLGSMLYHLLSGHMPYVPHGARITQRTLLGLVVQGPPSPILQETPRADPPLVAICEKAMARDPSKRYGSADEMRADLEAFLDFRPVVAKAPNAAEILTLFVKRNKTVVSTVAAALVLLLGSGIFFMFHLGREIEAKNFAIEETDSYQCGLRAERLLKSLDNNLYPLVPSQLADTEAWLWDADSLIAKLPKLQLAHKSAGEGSRHGEELSQVIQIVSSVEKERPRVASSFALAKTSSDRSIVKNLSAWDRAREDIAASAIYRHYSLSPQIGLAPIYKNPETQLWEFWVVDSGDRPELEPATNRYKLTKTSGIVLVLLPGGPFRRGDLRFAPASKPAETASRPNDGDGPRAAIVENNLAPFFISKFEVTQGQYLHLIGNNPSGLYPGRRAPKFNFLFTNPVETVTWNEARYYCKMLGGALPSESQWEYAARAGAEDDYWWGNEEEKCYIYENIVDAEYAKEDDSMAISTAGVPSDGFAFHAPVGSFAPNSFGLFDMLGNVVEWCADDYIEIPPETIVAPDGMLKSTTPGKKSCRGGSFHDIPGYSTAWLRRCQPRDFKQFHFGFRFARAIY